MIKAILACDQEWGIGKDGDMPWPHNSADLQWFKKMTHGQIVVMGRKTWESLPRKPLPNRINLVISSNWMDQFNPKPHGVYGGDDVCKIVTDVIQARYIGVEDICIIGGAQLVESCLPIIDELWLSRIEGVYDCDTVLPGDTILEKFVLDSVSPETDIYVEKWIKK
jgi:dihydrofolate reductase